MPRQLRRKMTPEPKREFLFLAWCRAHATLCFVCASACWVLLLYWRTAGMPFVYDDALAIQQNHDLGSWHSIVRYFRAAVPLNNAYRGLAGSIYRPLTWLGFSIERHLWGLHAAGFHLVNLALHWANGLLGFLLLRKLHVSALLAAVACLLWLGLPIDSEAVAWVSGRHTCQAAFFILLSLLAAVSYAESARKGPLVCYALAAAGAVLSNEWGILFLPLVLLTIWAQGTRSREKWFAPALAGLAIVAGYGALRELVGAHLPIGGVAVLPVGESFFKYVGWMLLPIGMSVERSTDTPANSFSPEAALALLLLAALLAAIYLLRQRKPAIAGGLAWMSIALLPFCGAVFIYQGMAERYTYLASGGLVFAMVAFVFELRPRWRVMAAGSMLIWMAWGAWRLEARLVDWQDETTLYRSSLAATPNSSVLLYNLGVDAAQAGRPDEAESDYRRALAANPRFLSALLNLGELRRSVGDYPGAIAIYRRAIAIDGRRAEPWMGLGNVYLQTGFTAQARNAYQQAVSLDPRNPDALLNLGAALQASGDIVGAKQHYRRAIALDPEQGAGYCDLGTLLFAEGQNDAARQQFETALQKNPLYAPAYFDLGVLYQRSGQTEQAARMYREALRLQPDYEKARVYLDRLR